MRSLLKPHGTSTETFEDGLIVVKNLYTCCHCQFTWEAETGSLGGALAGGFCGKCCGYICRNPACVECVPWEQRLENIEAGRPLFAPRKIMVPVPDLALVLSKRGSE